MIRGLGHALGVAALVGALGGCAETMRGESALRRGQYAEAATEFGQVLAEDPGRLDALIGLGIARYKLGDFADARQSLELAVTQAPGDARARLYLALTVLQSGDGERAAEHLRIFREQSRDPRVAAQVDRALLLLRSPGLCPEVRSFVAAALEDETALARELREARLRPPPPYYAPYPFFYDCVPVRHGRVVCF
jgi:Flp pilus assembly protein TadD